jgi:hypothetical protein
VTRRGPIFKDPLLDLIDAGQKLHTRRCDIDKWKGVKKGDVLWIPEGLVKSGATYDPDRETRKPNDVVTYSHFALYRRYSGPCCAPVKPIYTWHWQRDTHPSIFCPKACARVWVRATADAYIEQLQDISNEDAIKEGVMGNCAKWQDRCTPCEPLTCDTADGFYHPLMEGPDGFTDDPPFYDPGACFSNLWNIINDIDGKRWDDNPEVVVLAFERCLPPEAPEGDK